MSNVRKRIILLSATDNPTTRRPDPEHGDASDANLRPSLFSDGSVSFVQARRPVVRRKRGKCAAIDTRDKVSYTLFGYPTRLAGERPWRESTQIATFIVSLLKRPLPAPEFPAKTAWTVVTPTCCKPEE